MAIVIAATVGLSGFAAVLQSLSVFPSAFPMNGTSFNRATLGFGWPNELAVFIALGVPFAVYAVQAAKSTSTRFLALLGLGAAGLGLLTTFSRGSWLALVVATLALVLVGSARFVMRVVILGVVGAAILDIAAGNVFSARAGTLIDDPTVLQRASLQLVALLMFRDHPVVGVGPGGFAESLESYGPQVSGLYDYVGTAHNVYLDMAAETGILGLLAFLWFLLAAFRVLLAVARRAESPARAELRHALFWSFTVAILIGFTAWPFAHGLGQMVFLVLAAGIALHSSAPPATLIRRRTMEYAASSG
jgi:O-antigen ligase